MTTKNNKRGVNRRASQRKSPEKYLNPIPVFQSDVPQSLVVRYALTSASAKQFTRELPIYPFGVSSSSSTILIPFKSVRIARIRMWCAYKPASSTAENLISLTQVTRRGVRPNEWVAIASTSGDAMIDKSFDKNEPSGWFYITASGETNPEFSFNMSVGATLEITYVYVLSDGDATGSEAGSSLSFPRVYTNKLESDLFVLGKSTGTTAVF